ncbi:hypothetical protein B0T12DRAFT_192005 [Alternaria alternata]|jgi:hypothetical protein|nr:hypothetical protein B0T12DRAFT_192005 [Alternaria alternata]
MHSDDEYDQSVRIAEERNRAAHYRRKAKALRERLLRDEDIPIDDITGTYQMFSSDYLRFYVEEMTPEDAFDAIDDWDVGTIEIRPGAMKLYDEDSNDDIGIECHLMDQPIEGLTIRLDEIPIFGDEDVYRVDAIGEECTTAYITFLGEGVIELRLKGQALDADSAPQEVRYVGVQDEDEVIPQDVYDSEEWDMDAEDDSEDDSEDGSEDD